MIHSSCALLERLLASGGESDWLEFKLDYHGPQDLGEYVSALANGAMLARTGRAFLVFGVDDAGQKTGSRFRFRETKKGGENLHNWLSRSLDPKITLSVHDFECDGRSFCILEIDPGYERPVKFAGVAYIRVGENKRKLAEFPHKERELWMATGQRAFEDALALANQTYEEVCERLDVPQIFAMAQEPPPSSLAETARKLAENGYLVDNLEGRFDITNLGALLFARNLADFPSVGGKGVRVIRYAGDDKRASIFEAQGRKGYALGFSSILEYVTSRLSFKEVYVEGLRRNVSIPGVTLREVIANAMMHQDLTITGAEPLIEIYDNRVEVSNAGRCAVSADHILDERRSRNEKLARRMRDLGLCEERGGGLDKALIEIETLNLPAPQFIETETSFRAVLFGPRPFSAMTKDDRVRACFFHAVLRWMRRDYMSNTSLRERFSLPDEDYQLASAVIADAIRMKRIAPADPAQGRRNARYVPYWAAPT